MQKKIGPKKSTAILRDTSETNFLNPEATIFICYRRDDSIDEAVYLRAVLARRFGADKIFRDMDSLKLGSQFPEVIKNTLANASVVIVLIGEKWLTVKSKTGQARIKTKNDYVRLEIETALQLGKHIMPVLLDGAQHPAKEQLPASIARLATFTSIPIACFNGADKIAENIKEAEVYAASIRAKEAEERKSLNLEITVVPSASNKQRSGKRVIVNALEFSLEKSGKKILLDEDDFFKTLNHYKEPALREMDAFFFEDMMYVADFIGIKAKNNYRRYVARSRPLQSISELPAQLVLGRPVICSFNVYSSWFDKQVSKTGMIDFKAPKGFIQGGTIGVIKYWNPVSEQIKLLTPWPGWGVKGVATITKDSMFHINSGHMRSVEAVEKLRPIGQELLNLAKKMTTFNKSGDGSKG